MKTFARLGAAYALASTAFGQIVQYCAEPNICYSFNVPSATASSGNGDIYFQIQAPSSQQWVALGQGTGMPGANIFIVYADADGKNVTLSPRLGIAQVEPLYDSAAQVSLLEGSGISNGVMTANIRCSSCASWSGGSMSFTDKAAPWIWAQKAGSAISSDSQTFTLTQHDSSNSFTVDLTEAAGGNSLNPFVQSATSGTNPSSTTAPLTVSTSGTSSSSSGSADALMMKRHAHGFLMAIAFLILFPFGALTIRLLSFKGFVWIHAGLQLFAYAVAITGMGIGIWLAVTEGYLKSVTAHPIIGLVVVFALIFQPILGLIHHSLYRKTSRRTFWAVAHVWFGRALIILGVINGGLGLQLSANTTSGMIAYGVIAGVVFLIYLAVVAITSIRSRGNRNQDTREKYTSSADPSDEGLDQGRRLR